MRKTYKVNEIFYSLQGEGCNAGRAAVFVRFSGCNLRCPFCDTDFSQYAEMTAEEIVSRMTEAAREATALPMAVLTGGEPTLQADERLVSLIHAAGFGFVAMESNGTGVPPAGLDWLTVSPKGQTVVRRCDELKVVYGGDGDIADYGVQAGHYCLQPMDTGDSRRNAEIVAACVDYVKRHPKWRLSLQTHKLINIR